METIETFLNRNIFFDENSNFAILKSADGFTVKGTVLDLPEHLIGVKISFTGDFSNSRYGREFAFVDYKIVEGELFFFLTKIAKGISRSIALEIESLYGDNFEEIITQSPQKLLEIKGIGQKKLNKLVQYWEESKDLKKLSGKLSPYGITSNMIIKIYRHFGKNAVDVIDENPYRLTEIRGIGFKKSDEVARKIGLSPKDPRRSEACLLFCIGEYMIGSGHSLIENSLLFEQFVKESTSDEISVSSLDKEDYDISKSNLLRLGKIVEVTPGVFSYKPIFDSEMSVIKIVRNAISLNDEIILDDVDGYIENYESSNSFKFGENQKLAIALAASGKKIFSVTGYAGTGKTSASKAILKMFEMRFGYESIVCCALSGIAATRVKKQSGYRSGTIHSILGFDPVKGGFVYDEHNQLPHAVVLLDEASMVDIKTFDALLRAIDFERTHLILLGDPAQLPPVGVGEPFNDLISSKTIENVTLDKIYRQSSDKVITTFAQDVRNGNVPHLNKSYSDFEFKDMSINGYWQMKKVLKPKELSEINEENYKKIIDEIVFAARAAMPLVRDAFKIDAWEGLTRFQVIVPMKNGTLGVKNLNYILQSVLNPIRDEKDVFISIGNGKEFRKNDKVIHLQNKRMRCVLADEFKSALSQKREFDTFETKVFNGQIGLLFKADKEEDEYYIYYPNEGFVGVYSKSDFSNSIIDLAYALTGHKTQGSEFYEVVMPIVNAYWMMLNNKLLYTQMTRAKERLLIIGEQYAFAAGCKRSDETIRNTISKLEFKTW